MNIIKKMKYSTTITLFPLKFCYCKHQFGLSTLCNCPIGNCKILNPINKDCDKKIIIKKYVNKDSINNFNCLFTNKPPLKKDCDCINKCSAGQSELELYF